MGVRWIAAACVFTLLLVSSALTKGEEEPAPNFDLTTPLDEMHDNEGYNLYRKFRRLYYEITRYSSRAAGGPCNATVDQSYAYMLYGDVHTNHKIDGIIDYIFSRRKFYVPKAELLEKAMEKDDAGEPKVTFCDYNNNKLVCVSTECAACGSLPENADPKLAEACAFNGTSGKGAETEPVDPSQVPQPVPLERRECEEKRWLTANDMREWHKTITGAADYPQRKTYQDCVKSLELGKAFALLHNLVVKGNVEKEIEERGDFLEETLWVFRDGRHTNLSFCHQSKSSGEGGPWICGMDAVCLNCWDVQYHVTKVKTPPTLLWEVCEPKESPEEGWKKECGGGMETSTSGGSDGGSTGSGERSTEAGSMGVGVEGSFVVVTVSVVFGTGGAFTIY